MKKIISTAFILINLLCFTINAQKINSTITWGEKLKEEKTIIQDRIIGRDHGLTYVYKMYYKNVNKRTYIFEVLNEHFTSITSAELELKFEGNNLDLEHVMYYNGEICVFSSFVDIKSNMQTLYLSTLDKTTLLSNNDIKVISEIQMRGYGLDGYKYFGIWAGKNFRIATSEDNSKILIYNYLTVKNYDSCQVVVINEDRNVLWTKKIVLQKEEVKFLIQDFVVQNNGDVYCFGLRYEREKGDKKNLGFDLISIKNSGNLIKSTLFSDAKPFIKGISIIENSENDLICTGFYCEEKETVVSGVFSFKVDTKSNRIINKSFHSIDYYSLIVGDTDKDKQKFKKRADLHMDLSTYQVKKIILKKDRGYFLIAEQIYFASSTVLFEKILIVNYNKDGKVEWIKEIPKIQFASSESQFTTSEIELMSFHVSFIDNKLVFLFNDRLDNFSKSNYTYPKKFRINKHTAIAEVVMTSDGNFTKRILHNPDVLNMFFHPRYFYEQNNELILMGSQASNKIYGHLKYD